MSPLLSLPTALSLLLTLTFLTSTTSSIFSPFLPSSKPLTPHPPPLDLPWDTYTFSLNNLKTNTMHYSQTKTQSWPQNNLQVPLKPLELEPSSTILNYGQGLFEGLKAFRRASGEIIIFRPSANARRCQSGCERLKMPPITTSQFVNAVSETASSNAEFVPPTGQGALYLRPIVFGSGGKLGVAPSSEYTFCVWCSPVGNYFASKKSDASANNKEGTVPADTILSGVKPIKLLATREYTRASPGGVGCVKAIGNYAPVFKCQDEVKSKGYNEALFLDSSTGTYIEEAGASNFFAFFPNTDGSGGGVLVTPPLSGTILPGVTRDSVIALVKNEMKADNIIVVERDLKIAELASATEAFCCGTGASVTPVGSVMMDEEKGNEVLFGKKAGLITERVYKLLYDIQWGTGEKSLQKKYKDWVHVVKPAEKKN